MSDRLPSFVEPLPAHPNVEMQQKRARALLRAIHGGEAVALARLTALHPHPPAAGDATLADAQLVVARGYGFPSWAAMKRKIESLVKPPIEQFAAALRDGDIERVRALLAAHAEVRAAINSPIGPFGSRPAAMVKTNLPLLDVLLAHGADLNRKSDWWAGGFGLLESDCTPEQAVPLIARGAVVDVWAAAHLGMHDRVRELLDADPSLVQARGGDGKTPLHCARTVDVAREFVERGADLDTRDVDHESTPAQHLVREAPEVARFLVDRGAWYDIYLAIGLRDRSRVEQALRDDPGALDHRTWHGKYVVAHHGSRASTPEERDGLRGDIYRWTFGHNLSPLDVAYMVGDQAIVQLLLAAATAAQRLLAAAARGNRSGALEVVAAHPDVVARLSPDQLRVLPEKAHANDTEAVRLLIDLGFDPRARGPEAAEAIRWASFLGNAELVELLLRHDPPIGVRDRTFGSTLLGWCIHGAVHGWRSDTGDFAAIARMLLQAGEPLDPAIVPTGRDDLDEVLRERITKRT